MMRSCRSWWRRVGYKSCPIRTRLWWGPSKSSKTHWKSKLRCDLVDSRCLIRIHFCRVDCTHKSYFPRPKLPQLPFNLRRLLLCRSRAKKSKLSSAGNSWVAQGRCVLGDTRRPSSTASTDTADNHRLEEIIKLWHWNCFSNIAQHTSLLNIIPAQMNISLPNIYHFT